MPAYPLLDTPGTSMDDLSPKTAQILKEVEQQYRLQQMLNGNVRQLSGSTPNLASMGLTLPSSKESVRSTSSQSQRTMDEISRGRATLEKVRREKQSALQELKSIQKVLERNRSDIRQTERQLQESRAKTEEARTELVLAEFKREAARKDLEHLAVEMAEKQAKLQDKEIANSEQSAIQKEEISALMKENGSLKERLRDREHGDRERRELERTLNTTKDELFTEQKQYRSKLESLQEELDQKSQQLEEAMANQMDLNKRHNKSDIKFRQMEREKNAVIQEKTRDYEDLRRSLDDKMADLKATKEQEVQDLRQEVQDTMQQLSKVEEAMKEKEDSSRKLREQLLELQTELTKEREFKDAIVEEHQENIETVRAEKNEALKTLRARMEEDKQECLESLRSRLDAHHQELLNQAEHQLLKQVQELQSKLTGADMELEVTRERLRQQEALVMTMSDSFRQEAQDQVRSLIETEKRRWNQEKAEEMERNIADYRHDMELSVSRLRDELTQAHTNLDQQTRQITALKEELEEQRESNHKIYREKLSALNEIKDAAAMEKDKEMDEFKEKLEKETFAKFDRLRDTIRKQEEDVERLRAEKQECAARERELMAATEKQERGIITSINDECRKIAELVGTSPRRTTLPGFSTLWSAAKTPFDSPQNVIHQALETALANFRASTEDIRKYTDDLRHDIERHKQALLRCEQLKSEEFEGMRMKFQNDKTQAMDDLKSRLIKDHIDEVDRLHKVMGKGNTMTKTLREKDIELREIQRNMSKWREDTAEKLAKKFQDEMNKELEKRVKEFKRYQREWELEKTSHQKELDRMERELSIRTAVSNGSLYKNSLRAASTPPGSVYSALSVPASPAKSTRSWQRESPSNLINNCKLSNSLTDLTHCQKVTEKPPTPGRDTALKQLELRAEQAERRAKQAEERAETTHNALNLKMIDLSRLQGDLSHQTKEYMQLERAYTKLQTAAVTPSKPLKSCLR